MKIVYICDKRKKCGGTRNCGNYNPDEFKCNHTLDPNHALNGISKDPEHDSRFRLTEGGFYEEILQEEKE